MGEVTPNFKTEGSGAPQLPVHGFGISSNLWRQLVPRLHPHCRLVMVQLSGIGSAPGIAEGRDYLQACIQGVREVRRWFGIISKAAQVSNNKRR